MVGRWSIATNSVGGATEGCWIASWALADRSNSPKRSTANAQSSKDKPARRAGQKRENKGQMITFCLREMISTVVANTSFEAHSMHLRTPGCRECFSDRDWVKRT